MTREAIVRFYVDADVLGLAKTLAGLRCDVTYRSEIDAVRTSGARMIVLTSREAIDTWHQLEVVMSVWRQIERCCAQSGPFIYTATRSGLRAVNL